MEFFNQDSLIDGIQVARDNGFTTEFLFDNRTLVDRDSKKVYVGNACFLLGHFRYEGMSNPSDSSILFLIRCDDGNKGYVTSAYGVHANEDLIQFILSLKGTETKNIFPANP